MRVIAIKSVLWNEDLLVWKWASRWMEGTRSLSVILKNTAAAQEESHGDGAVSATFFACSLIHMLNKQGPLSSASRSLTASVFQRCLEWCIERLHPIATKRFEHMLLEKLPLSLGNVTSMTALIRGMFSTKAFAQHLTRVQSICLLLSL